MDQEINVIIRIMPQAEEVVVSLPLSATPRDVIETLLDANLGVRKIDEQGNAVSYQLVPKGSGAALKETQTLQEGRLQVGDVILMVPTLVAG